MRSRLLAVIAGVLALVGCTHTTETSSGVLATISAPTATPATPTAVPAPTPTPPSTATPDEAARATSPTRVHAPTPASVQRIEAGKQISSDDLASYVEWIESKLERPLVAIPTVTGMDRDELLALVPEGRFVPGDTWELLVALGLVETGADRLAADEVRRLDVRGGCCPIVLRDTGSPALNEMLLVHELTHAADDPGGGLATQRAPEFVPMSIALVEGNAHRVAFDYANDVLATTYPDFEPPSPVFSEPDHPDLPAAVRDLIEFPYEEGQQFARELAERGGEAAILEAFRSPPATSEHIIDVDSYLAGELPSDVETPSPPELSDVVSSGTLGAFLLQQVMGQTLDAVEAHELASGWDGDRYVLYRQGQQRCITVRIVVETDAAVARLVDVLDAAAESPLQLIWSRCSDDVPTRGVRSD